MTKLLFLSLGTSFILSACASPQSVSAFEQPNSFIAKPITPEQAAQHDHRILSTAIEAQQARIEALEFALAKLQTQLNALSKSQHVPTTAHTATEPTPPKAPSVTDQSILEQAQRQFQQKEYVAMVDLLKAYANGGNRSLAAQGNMFLLSAAHFSLSNCEASISIGRRFANDFKQHPNAPAALYNIANCQLSMKQKDVASTTLRNLIRTYPNSNEAQRAKILLK